MKYREGKKASYCPQLGCGEYIHPFEDQKSSWMFSPNVMAQATCQRCGKEMCISCNGQLHSNKRPCVDEKTRASLAARSRAVSESRMAKRCAKAAKRYLTG
jgi:hypothetical protein